MIILSLGKMGSGKTLTEVSRILKYRGNRQIYTNIHLTKPNEQIRKLTSDMLVKKKLVSEKKKRDGTIEQKYKYVYNVKYWEDIKEPTKLIIDEGALFLNARDSMNAFNKAFTKWLYLIRRVLKQSEEEQGNMVLIAQVGRTVDVIARELANLIRYHRKFFWKVCQDCKTKIFTHNDHFEGAYQYCRVCGSENIRQNLVFIRIYHFNDTYRFENWLYNESVKPNLITTLHNPQKYFNEYDTEQFDGLIED